MLKKYSLVLIAFLCLTVTGFGQVTIGIQDFETSPATPTMTYTGGSIATGTGPFPTDNNFVSGSRAIEVNNGTETVTFSSVDASTYTNVYFTCRLASFAGTSGNGADGSDEVYVEISTDGGSTWSEELEVQGNANAKWSFDTGTATASTTYDGNNSASVFTPSGGGYRTTDGYSTIIVDGLPSVNNLRVRLVMNNNSGNEYWIVDDAEILGTLATTNTIVAFSSATSTVTEDGLFFDVCVDITNEDSTATTVQLTLDGASTATNGTDYDDGAGTPAAITFPQTLTFPANSSASQCFTFYISNDDAIIEGNETVVLNLINPSGGDAAALGGITQHTVTITDNDLNDICTLAIPLTATTTCSYQTFSNVGATDSGTGNPGCSSLGPDVWFSVVVPSTGEITIDTDNIDFTDSGMALYSGSCGSLSLIECDDDDSPNGNMSLISRNDLTPGDTVYIRVWEYGGGTEGTFDICVTTPTPCTAPTNQPTGLTLSNITGSSIDGSFSATTADEYLVVVSTSSTLGANPVDGVTYNNGDTIGSGTVVQSSNATTFTATGLSQTTQYYFFVFAYNDSSCAGGPAYNTTTPLTGDETTITGPCLSELNFTSTPSGWIETNITYASTEANFASTTGELTTLTISNPSSLTFDLRRTNNSNAKNLLIEVSTTTQGGTFTTINTFNHGNTTAGGTTNCTVDLSAYTSFSTVFIKFRKTSSTTSPWYLKNVEVYCGSPTPAPEIDLKQGTTSYATTTLPTGSDTFDFGNHLIGTNTDIQFTIENTGDDDLTLSAPVISGTGFSLQTGLSSTLVSGPSGTSTFTVRFTPNALGAFSGTISIPNNDDDEDPYVINIVGNGTNSNLSSIVDNTNYSTTSPEFNSNTEYINFIDGSAASTGKYIPMKLRILDGPDADGFDTSLTDISFTVEDLSNTSQLSMIKTAILTTVGGTPLATATKVGNELVFSGMNSAFLTATDDDSNGQIFHLRVSFDETQVIDRTKLVFKVSSASADPSGSSFSDTDAGGAETDTGNNNRNRLNVTADRLTFTVQPSDTSVSINMSPSPIVSLTDLYGNTDIDITSGTITITSTGTPNAQPSGTIFNGQAIFNSINHSAPGTGLELIASFSGWNVTSNLFNVSNTANGSYRTTGSGNWLNNQATPAIWERFNGSAWVTSNSPSYNTSNIIYIRHTINSNGSFGNNVEIIVENSGFFDCRHSATSANITVNTGGTFDVDGALTNTGYLEVHDGGTLILNHAYGNGSETILSLWDGTEIFHPNSNLVLEFYDTEDDYLIPNNTVISSNTYDGYTAVFGNVIIDFGNNLSSGDDFNMLKNGVTINMAHGDLIFRSQEVSGADMRLSSTGTVTSGIGGNFIVENGYTGTQLIHLKTSGTLNFTVKGNMELNAATTRIAAGSNPNSTLNIEGNIDITPSAVLQFNSTISASANAIINLYGDITVAGSGLLYNTNSSNHGQLNFVAVGDGLTDATTQTIDIASTSSNENKYINFYVKNGAYVKLINQDLELGTDSGVIVENGGTLDFGFDGSTALNVGISGSQTGSVFSSQSGSSLVITSPDGINTTGYLGNVQTLPSGRTFNQTANFYYVGKENQVTGNALTVGSSVKNVYAILDNDNVELRLTNRTGISDGGKLEIQQGIVIGEEAGGNDNDFYGPDGQLIMTGGEYRISTITANPLTDYLPQLRKYSSYSLTGGTVHLNGDNEIQILSGTPNYFNLAFSGTNTLAQGPPLPPLPYNYKGISIATSIANNVTISENAIVDVENKTFGGNTTNLIMEDNSRYVTAGTGTKPDATGTYSLGPDTTIEFNNNGGFESIRLTNPVPAYANIVVSGDNVGTIADGSGPNSFIQFQANGTFTVTETGIFKQSNTNGFSGLSNTSISNVNNPSITLLDESTVEYQGANQTISEFTPEYKNVTISGTGIKTLGHATDILVGEDLNINSSVLFVDSNEAITVDEGVKVTGGNFNIEDSGSLIQINETDTNSGAISMKRNTNVRRLDYVYWSSPVENFDINTIYDSQTPTGYIYEWNTTIANPNGGQGNWVTPSNSTMQRGKGYIVRGPNDHDETATIEEAIFNTGKPFNGEFTVNVYRGDNPVGFDSDDDDWNLLGNPYPSAIDAYLFLTNLTNRTAIDGFVNLWTHGTLPNSGYSDPFYDDFGSNYTASDYITYNGLGSTAGIGDLYIGAGQSFMVNMNDGPSAASLPVEFKNDMRRKDFDNSQFYRNSNTRNQNKHRIWLDFVSDVQPTNRILVGYAEAATNERDRMYDAITDNQAFYSLIGDKRFVIQGKGLPFNDYDVIPLGVKINAQGNHYIALAETDGLFEIGDQIIYIRDNESGYIHNLIDSPYSFNSVAGTFNNRFEIVFRTNALSVDEVVVDSNTVSIIELDSDLVKFTVHSNQITIREVEIIDLTGRTVYNFKGENNSEIYNLSNLSSSAYVAKITLSNGQVVAKKAIKK